VWETTVVSASSKGRGEGWGNSFIVFRASHGPATSTACLLSQKFKPVYGDFLDGIVCGQAAAGDSSCPMTQALRMRREYIRTQALGVRSWLGLDLRVAGLA
jgi:hypothetical protein